MILSGLMLMNVSCKKKKKTVEDPNWTNSYPTPGSGGTLPASILPASLVDSVTAYFNIYTGESPVVFMGEFVSHPHILLKSTIPGESAGTQFSDRYIAFDRHGDKIDFFGKQWSNDDDEYIVETNRNLYVIGTGENFSCYYLTEGYPNGMYAKFSTIFSGKWNASYNGLKDFQVAVIMLETSDNPHLAPVGSFRVLGDGDGLAQDTAWISGSKGAFFNESVTDYDPFSIFRVK